MHELRRFLGALVQFMQALLHLHLHPPPLLVQLPGHLGPLLPAPALAPAPAPRLLLRPGPEGLERLHPQLLDVVQLLPALRSCASSRSFSTGSSFGFVFRISMTTLAGFSGSLAGGGAAAGFSSLTSSFFTSVSLTSSTSESSALAPFSLSFFLCALISCSLLYSRISLLPTLRLLSLAAAPSPSPPELEPELELLSRRALTLAP